MITVSWHLYTLVIKVSHSDAIVIPMRSLRTLVLWSAISVLGSGAASSAPLSFSASGQFGSAVTASQLAGPSALWSLSFTIDSDPVAGNPDQLGFDAPFNNFAYRLNNSAIAVLPQSIRFSTASNLGLFTIFFGPQSGFNGGVPIPEFSFQGAQLFSGSTTSPTLVAGTYPVSEFVYSDAANYDDHRPANFTLTVANVNVPEPSQFVALVLGLALIGCSQICRLRSQR